MSSQCRSTCVASPNSRAASQTRRAQEDRLLAAIPMFLATGTR
jgi:hypothetical protein